MGSAAIAASAAKTTHPVRQGLVSMTQTFIDTIIVVTMTACDCDHRCVDRWQGIGRNDDRGCFPRGHRRRLGRHNCFRFHRVLCVLNNPRLVLLRRTQCGTSTRIMGFPALPHDLHLRGLCWRNNRTERGMDIGGHCQRSDGASKPGGMLILSGLIAKETKAYLAFDPTLRAAPKDVEKFLIDTKNPWRADTPAVSQQPHLRRTKWKATTRKLMVNDHEPMWCCVQRLSPPITRPLGTLSSRIAVPGLRVIRRHERL